eukprot:13338-Prymnesium_polylepis.1
MWLHEASMPALQSGPGGGGGVRVLAPGLYFAPAERPWNELPDRSIVDDTVLPPAVLKAAQTLGTSNDKLDNLPSQLDEMRRLLDEYAILPTTVAAVLIAEYMSRNDDATPTERQQVDLLSEFINARVLSNAPLVGGPDGGGG